VKRQGALAEWLGSGLQSRVQQFESARRLSPQKTGTIQVFDSVQFIAATPDIELLRAHGLRVTSGRLAVLAALRDVPPHATVEQVEGAARARVGSLSTQAVYDILRAFHDASLVRRIEPAGSPARYETRVGDNHHHLICRDCGVTVDVDCAAGEAPCLHPSAAPGFEVDEAEVIFWGRCAACLERKEQAS
jgi:Fe2+ or Zn2+ uptake regulation protein